MVAGQVSACLQEQEEVRRATRVMIVQAAIRRAQLSFSP
jgi:hypothetical protein